MSKATIPIELIRPRSDARPVDKGEVASLAASIEVVGLLNPIRVRGLSDGWELIAGAHRVEAHRRLGLREIEAIITEDDDLHAELAMIDENLCRAELSPADRARQTARRKAIYEELHGPAKAIGAHAANAVMGNENASANLADAFSADTAGKTGLSERTVQRDAERGEKVIAEVLGMVRGTKLDTGTYLDKLKKLPPNDQFVAAKRDLTIARQQDRDRSRRVAAPISADQIVEKHVAALMRAWNEAPQQARDEFLSRVGGGR